MTTATHASMAGADLHEPKGVAAATANKVYVSDGAGSGSWLKLPALGLDTVTNFSINRQNVTFRIAALSTSGNNFFVIPYICTVNKIWTVIQGTTNTAQTILTCKNNAGSSMGTITVANGAVAGTVGSLVPVSNNTFTAGQTLNIASNGGSGAAVEAMVLIDLTITG